MKKRSFTIGALIAIAAIGILAFGFRRAYVLTSRRAPYIVTRYSEPHRLYVYGRTIDSGLGVARVTQQPAGRCIVLRVYMRLPEPTDRNDFSAILDVAGVDAVEFGDPPGSATMGTLFGYPIRRPTFDTGPQRILWSRQTLRKSACP